MNGFTRLIVTSFFTAGIAWAQTPPAETTLPGVQVIGPKWESHHGGYAISSDFKIDPKLSAVVFPAEPFQQGDILDFRTVRMNDDEYFVLQECASADCTQAHILQVWTNHGAMGQTSRDPNRFLIPHEGKIFMWMQRFPASGAGGPENPTNFGEPDHGSAFTGFAPFSPPLVLNPIGSADLSHSIDIRAAQEKGPEKVVESTHDGMQMKLRFESGATVFIERLRVSAE